MRRIEICMELAAAALLVAAAAGSAFAQEAAPGAASEQWSREGEATGAARKVAEAKRRIEEKGEAAFGDFQNDLDRWLGAEEALYIINATMGSENEGLFLVYPPPVHVGEGAFDMPLVNGKPYLAIRHGMAEDKGEAGWFRLMRDTAGREFLHAAALAKAPSGKTYAIAAAENNIHLQKLFITEMVKAACLFMQAQGELAFNRFSRPGTVFEFKNTYVYVMDTAGKILFDPGLPQYVGKTIAEVPYFRRSAGRDLVKAVEAYLNGEVPPTAAESWAAWMKVLRKYGYVWGVYLAPRPGETELAVKAGYCRLITALGKEYVVGSGIYLADAGRLADQEFMKKVRERVAKEEKEKQGAP